MNSDTYNQSMPLPTVLSQYSCWDHNVTDCSVMLSRSGSRLQKLERKATEPSR